MSKMIFLSAKKTNTMSLKILQQQAGVTPDGKFGKNTFKAGAAYLGITVHARAVHFFAQVAHESGMFKHFSENLNYSADSLLRVFKKYFPDIEIAEIYARDQERIANRVYANRMGNGDYKSGDGWKFRGRGAIQLTGTDNYTAFSNSINEPEILINPELVAKKYAFTSAMYFFDKNKLWQICDEGLSEATIEKLTKKINGGLNGIEHRKELTLKYRKYVL